jgi:predicted nuclease with TOPRIM domain
VKYSEFRDLNKQHMKRLKEFETERVKLIEKIKSLKDELNESKNPLEKFFNNQLIQFLSNQECCFDKSELSFDKIIAASLHVASTSTSRTIYVY